MMLGVGAEVLSTQPKMPTLTAAEKREPNTAETRDFGPAAEGQVRKKK